MAPCSTTRRRIKGAARSMHDVLLPAVLHFPCGGNYWNCGGNYTTVVLS